MRLAAQIPARNSAFNSFPRVVHKTRSVSWLRFARSDQAVGVRLSATVIPIRRFLFRRFTPFEQDRDLFSHTVFSNLLPLGLRFGPSMQAEKTDTETEKVEKNHVEEKNEAKVEKNDADKESAEETVANKTASLKIEDDTGSSTPSSPGAAHPGSFVGNFKAFSKFGDSKSDGKLITLSQSDKWMKQAKVIDGKKITTTDTGIYFKKHKSMKLGIEQYKAFLDELAKAKKVDLTEMKKKMGTCGPPGVTSSTAAGKAASAVDRLTDVSKYTGSHKQRFDQTGKGKGIAGRKDLPDESGYVQGYQNKDTYNKAH